MKRHLTPENRTKLIQLLAETGCECDEEHDWTEDATSLPCLADNALQDLKRIESVYDEMDTKLTEVEVNLRQNLRQANHERESMLLRLRAVLMWVPTDNDNRIWLEEHYDLT